MHETLNDRFWSKVNKTPDCWIWIGAQNKKGYGHFMCKVRNGYFRPFRAHRISWEMAHQRKIPKEMVVDHLCRVTSCVNPAHLELVTAKENVLRGTGLTAIRRRQTHCIHGHELSGLNLYIRTFYDRAERHCRECDRLRCQRYRDRIKRGSNEDRVGLRTL